MKYIIDCGTHFFEGLKVLNNIYNLDKSWTVYSFEANPFTYDESKKYYPNIDTNIIHQNIAVSTKGGEAIIHCDINNNNSYGEGSNILINPPQIDTTYGNHFSYIDKIVPAIDLFEFINQLKNIEYLALKLDVEGLEFEILHKIITTEIYKKINFFYVEFHERFFKDHTNYSSLKAQQIQFLKTHSKILEWH